MIRLPNAPRLVDFLENVPSRVNLWLEQITARWNIFEKAGSPIAAEIPKNQWGMFKDTSTSAIALIANDEGTIKFIGSTAGVAPAPHAITHKSGGTDVIKLDELGAPTDITTLNASTLAHGLLPKLSGTTTTFLRGDGTWTVTPGVTGPGSAVNNNVVFFNGTTGAIIKDSGLTLSGSNTGDETTATIKTKLGITTLSGSNTGDQTISITGDGTAAGSAGVLTLAVTKVNGVAFSGLTTGILKNTTTTGVPSIAVAGTDYVAPGGALGTPSSGTLTNCTGYTISNISGMASGASAFLILPTSANLATLVSDETGTGALVFGTAPDITNPKLLSTIYYQQPAQTSLAAAATLTIAQLLTRIIQYTGAAATLTLPTGTLIDAGILAGTAVDRAFEFTVINTGSGAVTMAAGVGITIVGSVTVAIGASGQFAVRKTAANTFTVYRTA